nr:hypothetical protein HmN_000574400 [Hymenolepis microstoma]
MSNRRNDFQLLYHSTLSTSEGLVFSLSLEFSIRAHGKEHGKISVLYLPTTFSFHTGFDSHARGILPSICIPLRVILRFGYWSVTSVIPGLPFCVTLFHIESSLVGHIVA